MEIDNFAGIQVLLSPLSKNDFYFVQIIQRRKENPLMKSDSKIIKSYYVEDCLENIKESVIKHCMANNGRAYIQLQKRNWLMINLQIISKLSDEIAKGTIRNSKSLLDSCCGKYHSDTQKFWIIDVDSKDLIVLNNEIELLNNLVLGVIPTVNGFHIIIKPFNPSEYKGLWEIKKDPFTILYANR